MYCSLKYTIKTDPLTHKSDETAPLQGSYKAAMAVRQTARTFCTFQTESSVPTERAPLATDRGTRKTGSPGRRAHGPGWWRCSHAAQQSPSTGEENATRSRREVPHWSYASPTAHGTVSLVASISRLANASGGAEDGTPRVENAV